MYPSGMSGEDEKPETPEKPEIPQEPQWCAFHPGVEAVAKCDLCGKPVCDNCFIDLAGKKACTHCKPAIVGEFILDKPARLVIRRRRNPFRASIDAMKRLLKSRKKEVHIDGDTVKHLTKMRKEQVFEEWFRQDDSHPERYGMEFKIAPKRELHDSDRILLWGFASLLLPLLSFVTLKKVLAYRDREKSDNEPEDADVKIIMGLFLAMLSPILWTAGLLLLILS